MEKLALLVTFATFVALSSSLPSKEQVKSRREELDQKRENEMDDTAEPVALRNVLCTELGLLKHYHVDLGTSHIPCDPITRKRPSNLFAREFKKREFEYELMRNARNEFGACCSPGCDWLLDYLEIDATVVKCLDRK